MSNSNTTNATPLDAVRGDCYMRQRLGNRHPAVRQQHAALWMFRPLTIPHGTS
jgi:hypothetical protein